METGPAQPQTVEKNGEAKKKQIGQKFQSFTHTLSWANSEPILHCQD
jgi:hypothetical protein